MSGCDSRSLRSASRTKQLRKGFLIWNDKVAEREELREGLRRLTDELSSLRSFDEDDDNGAAEAALLGSIEDLQPGDIVAFNNTYRFSQNEGDHTHVGVYAGDGQFIHRPTQSAGYQPGSAAGEVIKEDLQAYIDRDRGRFEASFAGGYRFE